MIRWGLLASHTAFKSPGVREAGVHPLVTPPPPARTQAAWGVEIPHARAADPPSRCNNRARPRRSTARPQDPAEPTLQSREIQLDTRPRSRYSIGLKRGGDLLSRS